MSDWSAMRAALFACALLIAPAMAVWYGWTYLQLNSWGVTASGIVIGKSVSRSRRSTTYSVEYSFADAAGTRRYGDQTVGHDRYAQVLVGQRIDIVYVRSNPGVNVAHMDVLRERVAFLSFASLVIALLVGGFAGWWSYAERKTREYDAEVKALRGA